MIIFPDSINTPDVLQWQFLTHRTLHEQTMARLTLGIAAVFILTNVPSNTAYLQFQFQANLIYTTFIKIIFSVSQNNRFFQPDSQQKPDWYENEIAITNFFECINYSINFYVYCLTNGEIRRAVVSTLQSLVNMTLCCKRERHGIPNF